MRKDAKLGSLLMLTVFFCWLGCAAPDAPDASDAAPAAEATPETTAEASTDDSAGVCANQPYVQRVLAAQDAFTSTKNFLRCTSGRYALCYYSGPSPLPCNPGDDETGNCQCQVFEASSDAPMYVEIGGILNECIYNETVATCNDEGGDCSNMCADKPHGPGCQNYTSPPNEAPVCNYIATNTFNPDAEIISTFSFATVYAPGTDDAFVISSTTETGRYAGCMTAPCTGVSGDPDQLYTTCACPLWPLDPQDTATYQYGRQCTDGADSQSTENCTLDDGQMWSAAVSDMQSLFEPAAE